ncbi:hydroxyacid dehydrogenase [Nibricoccus aquaticus]|uniref:NADH-quinone oxidoreductase subunit H n=1 Tax=Nibricoccus aquaticus TaxID=2576891 RepID=A0A290QF54_9BACT|nr:complex I subunit 1 family protein [Nibricoccus aquaticus]ATC64906.1 hydroxyacid dehydrogenase [Nibricoccus aquaticus]
MFDFFFNLPLWVQIVAKGLAVIAVVFPIAGACSLAERKVSAWIQGRPGPNRALPWGLGYIPVIGPMLQKLGVFHLMADGGKLLFKEDPVPGNVNKFYFILAPIIAIIPAFTTVVFVPFGAYFNEAGRIVPLILANLDIGLLGVFAVSSLGVYSLILAGWASNSKYPFLGGVRASAQLISYELSMTLSVVPVFLWINAPGQPGTLSLAKVVEFQSLPGFLGGAWFVFLMPLSAFLFLVALFAETNRQPFDMPESESDLVGGFHTEYGSFKWSLFFVAEYAHMTVGSGIFVLLFLGGWNPLPWIPLETVVGWLSGLGEFATHPLFVGILSISIFLGKVLFFIFFFMWVRWTLPRFRYDQVMKMGWQILLPLSIANLIFYMIAIAFIQK